MNEQDLGGIGKLSRTRLAEVIRHFKGCFNVSNVADCLHVTKAKARGLLALWSKNGWLQRIRPGVYLPVELAAESSNDVIVDPWVVATQLYPPCYIGVYFAIKNRESVQLKTETQCNLNREPVQLKTEALCNLNREPVQRKTEAWCNLNRESAQHKSEIYYQRTT